MQTVPNYQIRDILGEEELGAKRKLHRQPRKNPLSVALPIAVIIALLGLANIWCKADMVRMSIEIEEQKSQISSLSAEKGRLSRKRAELLSPGRLAKEASRRLGMIFPQTGEFVVMEVTPANTQRAIQAERKRLIEWDRLFQEFAILGRSSVSKVKE